MIGLMLIVTVDVGVLQQVFFIAEAWMSIAELGKALKYPPSKDPQRKEVLIVTPRILQSFSNKVVIFLR